MKMIGYCRDCHYYVRPSYGGPIECLSPKFIDGMFGDTESQDTPGDECRYTYDEGGAFHPGPDFGCVHYKERGQ